MSSHLVFREKNKNITTKFDISQAFPSEELKFYPLLQSNIKMIIDPHKSSKNILISLSNITRRQIYTSSFEIVISFYEKEKIPYIASNDIQIIKKENCYDMLFRFDKINIVSNFVQIYILYLPRLTNELNFYGNEGEKRIETTYKTVRCQNMYDILMTNTENQSKVSFKTAEEPPVTHIRVVKIIGEKITEIHKIQTKGNFDDGIVIPKDEEGGMIYCGVIEVLFPSDREKCFIKELSVTEYEYSDVPTMPAYKTRYGYDDLNGSIVFEFFLKEEPSDCKNRYEHIGVEICTKFGRSFEVGFGHISTKHPINVRFTPKDINNLGEFSGENIKSICYSNDRLYAHCGLPISYASKEDQKTLTFLRCIFDLFVDNPDHFRDKVQSYIRRFVFDPRSVTIGDFYDLLTDDEKGMKKEGWWKKLSKKVTLSTFEFTQPKSNLKSIMYRLMKPTKEGGSTTYNFLIPDNCSKNYLENGVTIGKGTGSFYSCVQEESFGSFKIKRRDEASNYNIKAYLFIRDSDYDSEQPFYDYYENREKCLFYASESFLSFRPLSAHPPFIASFDYFKVELTKEIEKPILYFKFKIGDETNEPEFCESMSQMTVVDKEKFFEDKNNKNLRLFPIVLSREEVPEGYKGSEEEVKTGSTYLCIDMSEYDSETKLSFAVSFDLCEDQNFFVPKFIEQRDDGKEIYSITIEHVTVSLKVMISDYGEGEEEEEEEAIIED
ncbi:hypothetical protein M9Y10_043200 [Tritrichomonas musculus]|uniref:Uncharacterized protein n=1 Tax=Tritrichomonas musculus TaxID=1915356 RepID=A0ABR2JZ06_9EUKA